MPESKKARQRFESRSTSTLADVRIVPQTSARLELRQRLPGEDQPLPGEDQGESAKAPEPALVSKLIDFIKSM